MTRESVEISSDDDDEIQNSQYLLDPKLVYKHNHGTVELPPDSLECLNIGSYLTDNIVQFYFAYLMNIISDKTTVRVHIFDSIFHEQLVNVFGDERINGPKLKQLYRWLDDVDIFQKHFLIFPVCSGDHWFAIVVCYPLAVKPFSESYDELDSSFNSDQRSIIGDGHIPGVIVMDSLGQNLHSLSAAMRVRDFLDFNWRSRLREVKRFSYQDMSEYYPRLPRQRNTYDCGLYMLMYIRCFLEQPDEFYRLVRLADADSNKTLRLKIRQSLELNDRESLKILIRDVCQTSDRLTQDPINENGSH